MSANAKIVKSRVKNGRLSISIEVLQFGSPFATRPLYWNKSYMGITRYFHIFHEIVDMGGVLLYVILSVTMVEVFIAGLTFYKKVRGELEIKLLKNSKHASSNTSNGTKNGRINLVFHLFGHDWAGFGGGNGSTAVKP